MRAKNGAQGAVTVRVECGPAFSRQAGKPEIRRRMEASLGEYVQELMDGLDVPGRVEVELHPTESNQAEWPAPFRAWVNGRRCRQQYRFPVPADLPVEIWLELAAWVLYDNRALLLRPEMVAAVLGDSPEVDSQAAMALFRLLLQDGFRLGLAVDTMRSSAGEPEVAATLYDRVVSAATRLGSQLIIHPSSTAREPVEEFEENFQNAFFDNTGLLYPRIRLETSAKLSANDFQIRLNDALCPRMNGVAEGDCVLEMPPEELKEDGITGKPFLNPARNQVVSLVRMTKRVEKYCEENEIEWLSGPIYIVRRLWGVAKKNAPALLTPDVLRFYLDELSQADADLLRAVRARFEMSTVRQVLRCWLDEGGSIKNLPVLLEGLLSVNGPVAVDQRQMKVIQPNTANFYPALPGQEGHMPAVEELYHGLRTNQLRWIQSAFLNTEELATIMTGERLEDRILEEELAPEERQSLEEMVDSLGSRASTGLSPRLVTGPLSRRRVWDLLSVEFPDIAVFALDELPESTVTQELGVIDFNGGIYGNPP